MKKGVVVAVIPSGLLVLAVLAWSTLVFDRPDEADDGLPEQIYFADHISPSRKKVIDLFNERHRGSIEVITVDLPFDKFSTNERKELLARSLRSKSQKLDVFAVDLIWVSRFAKWAEPLDRLVSDDDRAGIIPVALNSCTTDSGLFALPMYIDIGLLYYRKDIIARLPDASMIERRLQESITWKELLTLRRRLGYLGKPFYLFQGKAYEGLVCNFLEIARSRDPDILSDGMIRMTSGGAMEAAEFMRRLIATGATPQVVMDFDENLSYKYMLDHDAVFVRGWPNFVENLERTYPDTAKLALIGRAPLPHFDGNPPTSVFGGWNLMVSRLSTHKAAALAFVRFLQTDEAQKIMFEEGGYIPVAESVYRDDAFMAKHPALRFYRGLMERGFHRPSMVEYTRLSDVVSLWVHRAVKGEVPPEEAMQSAQRIIESTDRIVQ